MFVKRKIKEWLKRYLPSEIVGALTAITAASIAHLFYSNMIIVAYVGSIGEAFGFYTTFFIQQIIVINKLNRANYKSFSISNFTKIISNMVLEYGPAGFIDGLFLRPFFMFLFPSILKNLALGILVGKIVGDCTFYLLVILSYELIKKKRT